MRFFPYFSKKKPVAAPPSKVFRTKTGIPSGSTKIFARTTPPLPLKNQREIIASVRKKWQAKDISQLLSLAPLYLQSLKLGVKSMSIVRHSYRFLLTTILTLLILFVTYLSLFDSTFYLKKYTIKTVPGSFLSDTSAQAMIDALKKRNLIGLVPLNNYWFLNQNALNEALPPESNVASVVLTAKTWPDGATLTVRTEPILATLAVQVGNKKEYLAIGQDGATLGYDTTNMRTNLVNVLSPVIVTKDNTLATMLKLEQHPIQLQKIWFAQELRQWLSDLHISVASVAFSSLSDYDPDIVVTTSTGTLLLFDYQAFDKDLQHERIITTWKQTALAKDEKNNLISYIDFRIEKRIFWCLKAEACSLDKNI